MNAIKIAVVFLVVLTVVGAAAAFAASIPAHVPDSCSPAVANHEAPLRLGESIGQSFVVRGNNLGSVSVVLGAEPGSAVSSLLFILRDGGPTGRLLRTVEVPASDLPQGRAGRFHPEGLEERWYTFWFEAVPDTSARTLWFAMEARGKASDADLRVLMNFHSRYHSGEAFQNGQPINANVLFRTHSKGRVSDYVAIVAANIAGAGPPLSASAPAHLIAATTYLFLLVALTVISVGLAKGAHVR